MSEPFLGEIRMFAGTFAPAGWNFCDGTTLQIDENEALYNLIGTVYGGDGQATFAVPDLRGRVPIHIGTGGGASYGIGAKGGLEQVTLTPAELPAHTHAMPAMPGLAHSASPEQQLLAATDAATAPYYEAAPANALAPDAISIAGEGQAHNNLQPYICINFIIALNGIYPEQN